MKASLKTLVIALITLPLLQTMASCSGGKSYADLLRDENMCVNSFLANQRVIGSIPADTVFEYGPNAPYYQLDKDGNLYMQVIDPGTPGNRAVSDQLIYFRFTRYNLEYYDASYVDPKTGKVGLLPPGSGNEEDLAMGEASFRFNNYTLTSSYQWGSGLQTPLNYLPIDCVVNIVIKSQFGIYSEMSNVVPYLYSVRYFPART